MEKYSLNKYDFKNFLLKELPDTRQVDLIFWKKTIPMPVDMIYGIFEKRGELLKKYVDHLGAAFIYSYIHKIHGRDLADGIEAQPTKKNRHKENELHVLILQNLDDSGALTMLKEIADRLLLYNYDVNGARLIAALCHEGRKYTRLYVPPLIRAIINEYDSELLSKIAQSNGDMFSNVVADELKVYRMGFADAFTGIFNKLIDYILGFPSRGRRGFVNASDIRIVSETGATNSIFETIYGTILDGSAWEPRYLNGCASFILNEAHPYNNYVRQQGKACQEVLIDFVQFLSEIENEVVRDSDRHIVEILRQEISRKLRVKAENIITINHYM